MMRGETDVETCRLNGWNVGSVLSGWEVGSLVSVQITAIGERNILARIVRRNGEPVLDGSGRELVWSLDFRDWQVETDGAA